MLSYGKADRIEIHVLDYQLLPKLLSKKSRNLHIYTKISVTLCVLERLKSCVCRNDKLILGCVKFRRLYFCRLTASEVFVTDLIQSSVLFDLIDKCIHLLKKLWLILINTKCVLLICQIDLYNFCCLRTAAPIASVCIISVASAS